MMSRTSAVIKLCCQLVDLKSPGSAWAGLRCEVPNQRRRCLKGQCQDDGSTTRWSVMDPDFTRGYPIDLRSPERRKHAAEGLSVTSKGWPPGSLRV